MFYKTIRSSTNFVLRKAVLVKMLTFVLPTEMRLVDIFENISATETNLKNRGHQNFLLLQGYLYKIKLEKSSYFALS